MEIFNNYQRMIKSTTKPIITMNTEARLIYVIMILIQIDRNRRDKYDFRKYFRTPGS